MRKFMQLLYQEYEELVATLQGVGNVCYRVEQWKSQIISQISLNNEPKFQKDWRMLEYLIIRCWVYSLGITSSECEDKVHLF